MNGQQEPYIGGRGRNHLCRVWIGLAALLGGLIAITGQAETIRVRARNESQIQRAIDRLPSTGGKVVILADAPVNIRKSIVIARDNVTLEGESENVTLRLATNANAPVIIVGDDAPWPRITHQNIHVRFLVIDGNRYQQTDELNPKNPELRNNGISLRRVASCSVQKVRIFGCRSGGLVTERGCRRITVRDLESWNNEFDGVAGYDTEDSLFTGLQVYSNQVAGLSFDLDFANNQINNSVVRGNGSVGIFMRQSHHNLFSSVQVRDSAQHGIFLAHADDDTATPAKENLFTGCVISGNGGAGIRVNDWTCTSNVICSVQFVNNAGGAISLAVPGLIATCENPPPEAKQ